MKPRIVCSFSCGAASAVATKLALALYADHEIAIINMAIEEEHPDNRRFLADCEKWFDHPVTVLRDEKYGASTIRVFKQRRFLAGRAGAPCSGALKRDVAQAFYRHSDEVVIGYTKEEEHRANRFIDANNERICRFPLIDAKLSKADCLGLLERAGIEMPAMYRLGYNNANCIGCVKGGQGYWNKIKVDFPERFKEISDIEEMLGAALLRYRSGAKKGEKMPLKDLAPGGRIKDEPDISCSAHCETTDIIFF